MKQLVKKYVNFGLFLLLLVAALIVSTWFYSLHVDRKPIRHPFEKIVRLSRHEEGWEVFLKYRRETREFLSGWYINAVAQDNPFPREHTVFFFVSEKAYPDSQDRLVLLPKTDINECWYHTSKYNRDLQFPRRWWGRECPEEIYVKVNRDWQTTD